MTDPLEPQGKKELHSTYMVQDRQNQEELIRLVIQDQMLTTSMGGVLPEQADPTSLHSVLDVACGTGGWAIEAAKTYPTMSLVGIDISSSIIKYARECANTEQVTEQVKFRVMDALRLLEFPSDTFDLVNMRFGSSFLRTWDWPKILTEFQRVIRLEGIIRITESDLVQSNSPALMTLMSALQQTLYNAGNFFRLAKDGLVSEIAPLLIRHGMEDVQTCVHPLVYHAGTPEGDHFAQDMQHLFRTIRPFIQKWAPVLLNYDEIYQQALIEMQQQDFEALWRFVTTWGSVVRKIR